MKSCVECFDCVVKRGKVRCRKEWWFNAEGTGQRAYKWLIKEPPYQVDFYERMQGSEVMQDFANTCKKWEGELNE